MSGAVLSIGVIGAGDIARTAHVPVLKALGGARLDWVADVDAARSQALGKAYKVPSRVLGNQPGEFPKADAVLLAIPYGARLPYYEHYRKQGAALYVEKPFARTAEEHGRICSWFPSHALASGLMMRSWSTNLMIREIVDSHMFGPLRTARFAHGRPGLVTYGRYYLDAKKGGGGMVSEFGIHGIDSLLFISRAQSVALDRVRTVWEGDLDLHTHAVFTLQLGGERTAKCEITVTGIEDLVEGVELEFDDAVVSYLLPGQGYALHGDAVDLKISVRPRRAGAAYHLTPRDAAVFPSTKFQMFHDFWSRFLDGVRRGESNHTTAAEAYLMTVVIDEIARERSREGGAK